MKLLWTILLTTLIQFSLWQPAQAQPLQKIRKRTPKKPYPTLKGIQFTLDMMAPQFPQAKGAKPEQFVDLSFLQELEAEGFFNEMEKRYR